MSMETIETQVEQLADISRLTNPVATLLAKTDSRYLRDVRVSLKNVLESAHLSQKETALLAVAIAANNRNHDMVEHFAGMAGLVGATEEEVAESMACASLLSANNVLYRFRHFTGKEKYQQLQAGIKMNIMARPVLGKPLFELISLAVSAVNGCEMCVNAHEHSVLELGYTEEQVWDAIRLSAVVTSFGKLRD